MSKIALSVTIDCEPDLREEVVRALIEHRKRCIKGEPGTLQFEILVPTENSRSIILFELYEDEASLRAHSNGASITQYREDIKLKTKSVIVQKCFQVP